MPTIALAVIAKNEAKEIQRICDDYSTYFDNIYVLIDEDVYSGISCKNLVVKKYKWSDEEKAFGKIFFDRKRTELLKFIKEDYYFRLDTDDSIINPEKIKDVVAGMEKRGSKICYTQYDYARDEHGNPTKHKRETIVRNDGSSFWNKAIHENLLPVNPKSFKCEETDLIEIRHNIDHEHSVSSLKRNLEYLVYEYNKDKENCDPRTIVYLAKTMFGMAQFDQAIYFFQKHIEKSGWNHDRFYSWCALSDVYRIKKDYKQAIASAMEALQECPDFPDGYLKMGDAHFDKGEWKKSIEWTNQGMGKKMPNTMMVLNMADYTWKPLVTLAMSHFMLSKFKEAYEYILQAKKFASKMEFIEKNEELFREAYEQSLFTDHLAWITKYFESKDKTSVVKLLESIPKQLDNHELVMGLKKTYMPPKTFSNKSIVFFCGAVAEKWSPKSTSKGIGGSEEAVINITKELAKFGYEVVVYNDCGDEEGEYDGVTWVNFAKFNPKDKFNIFVSWRTNLSDAIDAKHKIYWIHDYPNPEELTENLCRQTDKIIVLSKYHKSLLPKHVPEDKVYVSTNGVNSTEFEVIKGIERIPNRIIYASSYDRGLETILRNWTQIKTSCPYAEIHIYYGWNTYDHYLNQGLIKDGGKWKQEMCELMKQKGVVDHGRIGHRELLIEYAKASIMAYPGTYAGEINCIALTKAIACGCFPLSNDFAVLPERNTHGYVSTDENFIKDLIRLLHCPPKAKWDTEAYIKLNSWFAVADDWDKNVLKYNATVIMNRVEYIWSNIKPTQKVVDIGCQAGHIFKDTPMFENVTHVDLDDFGLPNYVKADATALPFNDKQFDVAVCAEILEHIPNDAVPAIKEAMRVSSKVIITVPYEHEWDEAKQPFRGKLADLPPEYSMCRDLHKEDDLDHLWHCRFYTPETLKKDIERAGAKDYAIVKLRHNSWSHIGAVIYG